MRRLTPREWFLLAGLTVVAAALWFGVGEPQFGTSAQEPPPLPDVGVAPLVKLDLLNADAADYDPRGRNLFAYVTPIVESTRVEEKRTVRGQQRRQAIRSTTGEEARPAGTRTVPLPQPAFRFIGYLGEKREPIGVFHKGSEVILAQAGDVIDSQFRLVGFRYETAIVARVGGRAPGSTVELDQRPG